MSDSKNWVDFNCPWCNRYLTRKVYKGADTEVVCDECKKSIGLVTDENGKPIRIGRLVGIETLMQAQGEQQTQRTHTRSDVHTNNPSINIGSVYGSVAFGGNVNTTNIYNETIKIINEAKNISEEQRTQAKGILEYAKTYASPFLPVIADAIKKALGL